MLCYFAVGVVKQRCSIDDSLDVFAVHGIGGATGVLLTAVFVEAGLGGAGLPEDVSMVSQLGVQALGVLATLAWSALATFLIIQLVMRTAGLRVSKDDEVRGLDVTAHGESAYNL